MAIRTIVALALALGTIGSALAATKQHLIPPRQSAYEQRNSFIANVAHYEPFLATPRWNGTSGR